MPTQTNMEAYYQIHSAQCQSMNGKLALDGGWEWLWQRQTDRINTVANVGRRLRSAHRKGLAVMGQREMAVLMELDHC